MPVLFLSEVGFSRAGPPKCLVVCLVLQYKIHVDVERFAYSVFDKN
jgi:hypothetical protein